MMRAAALFRILGLATLWATIAVPVQGATTVTIAWDPNPEPDVVGYNVYVGLTPNPGAPLFVGNRLDWTFTGLQGATLHYFAVQARSSSGALSPKSEISFLTPPPVPPGSEQSRSDFNGDGLFDVIWQHQSTGQLIAWHMSGAAVLTSRFLTPSTVGAGWKLKGSGDLNADGKPDLIWHNETNGDVAYWEMDGAFGFSFRWFNPNRVDPTWRIASVRDMNLDGKPDVLWQNQSTGQVLAWYLNGGTVVATGWLNPNPLGDTRWKLKGTADFTGDGQADLLWHNEGTGQLLLWRMNGANADAALNLTPSAVGPGWKIAAVGDANRDGWPDIFWLNDTSGQLIVWAMVGTAAQNGPVVGTVDTNWKIGAPK